MIEREWFSVLDKLPAVVEWVSSAAGQFPVQVEGGLWFGRRFYFRCRGDHVALWVSEPGAWPPVEPGEAGFVWYGEIEDWDPTEDAGRLSAREALVPLTELLTRYRRTT